jgi:CRP-like cAMP-binding protein
MTVGEKENLLAVVTTQKFQGGKKIVIEGEPGDLFYLIKEGVVSCSVKGVEIRKMEQGDHFGEQALLYNTTRTATVTAVDNVRVLSIGREQLREVLGTSLQRIIYRNTQRIALDKSEVLNKLTLEQKEKLIDRMQITTYQDGEVAIPAQTLLRTGLYIVLKGGLKVDTGPFAEMFAVIGERAITESTEEVAPTNIMANGESDIAYITKAEFEETLGGDISKISTKNEALAVLKKVSLFRGFSTDRLYQLLSVRST